VGACDRQDDVVATTLGDATVTTDTGTPALRVRRPGWRDPRLWIGVVLVAGSVVAGARLLAAADDTVQVWSPRRTSARATG
jgi:hypothetical protein